MKAFMPLNMARRIVEPAMPTPFGLQLPNRALAFAFPFAEVVGFLRRTLSSKSRVLGVGFHDQASILRGPRPVVAFPS